MFPTIQDVKTDWRQAPLVQWSGERNVFCDRLILFKLLPHNVSSSSFIFSIFPTIQDVKTDWRSNIGAIFAGPQVWIPAFKSNEGLKLLAVLLSFSSQLISFIFYRRISK